MLDTLMKFGAYRVNYFDTQKLKDPESFGFYIRAEIEEGQVYSHDAKHQQDEENKCDPSIRAHYSIYTFRFFAALVNDFVKDC